MKEENEDKVISIMDKFTTICSCKGVKKSTIIDAINNGASTVNEVWKATNTGNGSCNGKRCGEKIDKILNQ